MKVIVEAKGFPPETQNYPYLSKQLGMKPANVNIAYIEDLQLVTDTLPYGFPVNNYAQGKESAGARRNTIIPNGIVVDDRRQQLVVRSTKKDVQGNPYTYVLPYAVLANNILDAEAIVRPGISTTRRACVIRIQ